MTDQLESDLRTSLRRRAAEVPATSVARLVARDYRPRTRGFRPPVAIGAIGASAIAAGAAVAVVALSTGASSAFAGWTPVPGPPSPTQLAVAGTSCKMRSPIPGLPLKLTDARGPFTFQIYADSRRSVRCVSGPSVTAVSVSFLSRDVAVPADGLSAERADSHLTNRNGQSFSFADGHAGTGVTGATLVLDDATKVQATVSNGWFVAWWPGAHEVKRADVSTTTGVHTQKFDLHQPGRCDPHACTGGAIGAGTKGPVTGSGIPRGQSGARVSGSDTFGGVTVGQTCRPPDGHASATAPVPPVPKPSCPGR